MFLVFPINLWDKFLSREKVPEPGGFQHERVHQLSREENLQVEVIDGTVSSIQRKKKV